MNPINPNSVLMYLYMTIRFTTTVTPHIHTHLSQQYDSMYGQDFDQYSGQPFDNDSVSLQVTAYKELVASIDP